MNSYSGIIFLSSKNISYSLYKDENEGVILHFVRRRFLLEKNREIPEHINHDSNDEMLILDVGAYLFFVHIPTEELVFVFIKNTESNLVATSFINNYIAVTFNKFCYIFLTFYMDNSNTSIKLVSYFPLKDFCKELIFGFQGVKFYLDIVLMKGYKRVYVYDVIYEKKNFGIGNFFINKLGKDVYGEVIKYLK